MRVSPEEEVRELRMVLTEALSRPHKTIQFWLVSGPYSTYGW